MPRARCIRRRRLIPGLIRAGACALLAGAGVAHADGLADLKSALGRLDLTSPVKATLELRTTERHGQGKDAQTQDGEASVQLEDGPHGLEVGYARETLARMQAEARQQARDPQAAMPVSWALARLDAAQLAPLVSPAANLARRIDEAQFKGERPDTWQGRPARVLSFAVPMSHLSATQRQYVKHYEATLEIWIAADGTPLASEQHATAEGRAFVVISFGAQQDESRTYGEVADRLVTLHEDLHESSGGAGEHFDQHVVGTLQWQQP